MDELVERVRQALAEEYPGAPNGRVRDLPDRRAIRWYTATGLVDRPAGLRGRTALYGPRHLLQIVAVKRRQAQGRDSPRSRPSCAGATDEHLAEVARVPDDLLATEGPAPDAYGGAPRLAAPAAAGAPPAARATRIGSSAMPRGRPAAGTWPGRPATPSPTRGSRRTRTAASFR